MVTSPYEWKILELDEKPQTNKQTIQNFSWETYIHVYTKYIPNFPF